MVYSVVDTCIYSSTINTLIFFTALTCISLNLVNKVCSTSAPRISGGIKQKVLFYLQVSLIDQSHSQATCHTHSLMSGLASLAGWEEEVAPLAPRPFVQPSLYRHGGVS